MNIDKKYDEIVETLEKDERYLNKLAPDQLKWLADKLNNNLGTGELDKILCVVINTQTNSDQLATGLIKQFTFDHNPDSLIFLLNATRKHVITALAKKGKRPGMDYINILSTLLKHKNHEVVEWSLRTIDELGGQGIILKKDIESIKTSIFSLGNRHKRSITGLRTMLLRKWNHG